MTKKIHGGLDVTHNVTAQGKRTVQGINNQTFDDSGNMNIDTYTKQELLDIVSLIPLSHYGTHNYLPAGVSGSFDGAAENQNYRFNKVFLENDGTLVILRAGTNGSNEGVYYAYLQNALNVVDMNLSVNTNKEYRPGYFGSDKYAKGVISTDDKIVVGIYGSRTTTETGVFVSIMKGTLDDTQHSGFFIPYSTVAPDGGLQFAMQANDGSIYFFGLNRNSNRLESSVVRVVFNESAGTYTSTRITGWNNKVFYNSTENGTTNLVFLQNVLSKDISQKPYMYIPPSSIGADPFTVAVDIFAAQEPNSQNIRIKINGDAWCTSTTYNTRPQHGFSYVINVSTKQNTLDAGNDITNTPAPLTITDTGSSYTVSGNVLNQDPLYDHSGARNIGTVYNYLPTGVVFACSSPNLSEPLIMQSSKFPEGNVFDLLNVRKYISSAYKSGRLKPTFGSAIGSYIRGIELLPNNSTKTYSITTGGSIRPAYSVHKPTPTFTFKSIDLGTIKGYEPTTDRNFIADNIDNQGIISTVSGNNVVSNGGIFACDQRYTQSFSYDYKMNGVGTISVDKTVLDNFRNSEYSKVASSWNLSSSATKACILYVPQQADIPAFVLLSTVTTGLANYTRVVEVDVNTRVGNITSITARRVILESAQNGDFALNSGAYFAQATVGMTIYDGGSFYFVGFSNILFHNTIGNTNTPMFRGIVDKSSRQFSNIVINGYHPSYAIGNQPAALPGIGFGDFTSLDQSNKVVFRPVGTTIAEYNAWTYKGDPISVISQDVAQGFIVYFTEETPVLLSGKSFTLPITNIDLRTVKSNPSNSTFFIYVKMNQGNAEYHITSEVISETGTTAYNIFWIGTIKTNSIQIASIDVFKRSRLDVFGASLEAAGSSFPVSYGLPSNNGTINW